jgi:tetratricopeptide (TPR) repeat protein
LAIEHLQRAMRLSPRDPLMFTMQGVTAFAHFFAGRHDEAAAWAEKAFWERPNVLATLRIAAASNALAGRQEQAQEAIARALELDPDMRLSNLQASDRNFSPAGRLCQICRGPAQGRAAGMIGLPQIAAKRATCGHARVR